MMTDQQLWVRRQGVKMFLGETLNPQVSLKASVCEYICKWLVLAIVLVSFYCALKVNDIFELRLFFW